MLIHIILHINNKSITRALWECPCILSMRVKSTTCLLPFNGKLSAMDRSDIDSTAMWSTDQKGMFIYKMKLRGITLTQDETDCVMNDRLDSWDCRVPIKNMRMNIISMYRSLFICFHCNQCEHD